MKKLLVPIIALLLLAGGAYAYTKFGPQPNPDPNHTHADFAVWVSGKKLDFSKPEYMSGLSSEEQGDDHGHTHLHAYLHLHDGNGHVIHRHKPELTLGEFFASLGFSVASERQGEWCWYAIKEDRPFDGCLSAPMHLYVNGELYAGGEGGNPFDYVFNDGDMLLLTDALNDSEVQRQMAELTNEACRYSQTCPWRGKPPVENCVSDPTVPCVAPLD